MNDDIKNFLQSNVTEELLAVLDKCCATFDDFELPNWEDSILLLIFGRAEREESSVVSAIHDEFRVKLEYILGMHSLKLLPEAEVDLMCDVCAGLKSIDDYDDMDSIIDICDGDETASERFAEIMSMVTSRTIEEVMTSIESIDEDIITKIRGLVLQADDVIDILKSGNHVEYLSRLADIIAPDTLSYQSQIDAGMPLGLPFDTYYKYYLAANPSIDLTNQLHLRQLIMDLVGLALTSSDAYSGPSIRIQKVLNDLTSDVMLSMRADILTKNLLQKFTNEKN